MRGAALQGISGLKDAPPGNPGGFENPLLNGCSRIRFCPRTPFDSAVYGTRSRRKCARPPRLGRSAARDLYGQGSSDSAESRGRLKFPVGEFPLAYERPGCRRDVRRTPCNLSGRSDPELTRRVRRKLNIPRKGSPITPESPWGEALQQLAPCSVV